MKIRSPRLVWFFAIALIHYLATWGSFLIAFGATMRRFDTGQEPDVLETMCVAASDVLAFPVLPLLKSVSVSVPGPLGHFPFLANSALWAFLIVALIVRSRRRKPNRSRE